MRPRKNGRSPKDPAFQWYVADFRADTNTAHLTCLEVGAFHLLLDEQWLHGPLEDDHKRLARICKLSERDFEDVWLTLAACFPINADGKRASKRLEREREVKAEYREEKRRQYDEWQRRNGRSDGERGTEMGGERGGERGTETTLQAGVTGGVKIDTPVPGPRSPVPSGSDLSTDQGADKPRRATGKRRGPRQPNEYEDAWYDEMRREFQVEPAKLPPHGSIALGRLGKKFGAAAIRAKMRGVLADPRTRKFLTAKYLEEHWDTISAPTLFDGKPTVPPALLAEWRVTLERGEPKPDDRNGVAIWRDTQAAMAKYRVSAEDVLRKATA